MGLLLGIAVGLLWFCPPALADDWDDQVAVFEALLDAGADEEAVGQMRGTLGDALAAEADPRLIAQLEYMLAGVLVRVGAPEEALDHADRAIEISREEGYLDGEFEAQMQRAGALYYLDQMAESLAAASDALALAEELGRPAWKPHMQRAYVLEEQGRVDEAIASVRLGLELGEGVAEEDELAHYEIYLARILTRRGGRDEALALAQQAADRVASSPDVLLRADVYSVRGIILFDIADFDAAEADFLAALEAYEAVEDWDKVVGAMVNLAWIARSRGDPSGAREILEGASELESTWNFRVSVRASLADVLRELGEFEEARTAFEEALQLADETVGPLHPAAIDTLADYAYLLYQTGHLPQARTRMELALSHARSAFGEGSPNEAFLRTGLATIVHDMGEGDTAVEEWELALSQLEDVLGPDHPELAERLSEYADSLKIVGRYDDAIAAEKRAVAILRGHFGPDTPHVAMMLASQGQVHHRREQFDEALALLEEAASVAENGDSAAKVTLIIDAELQKVRLAADVGSFAAYESAIAGLSERVGADSPRVVMHLKALAEIQAAKGRPEEGLAHLQRLLDLELEGTTRNLAGASDREGLVMSVGLRSTVENYLSMGADGEAAYEAVLNWKGLATRIARTKRAIRAAARDGGIGEMVVRLRREIARKTLDGAAAETLAPQLVELARLERTLAEGHGLVAAPAPTVREVCEALPRGHVLVDYFRHQDEYSAFVLDGGACGSVRSFRVGPAEEIESAVSEHRAALADLEASSQRVDRRGEAVRDLLWTPLEAAIGKARRVWIVPDGAVANVAFATLPRDGRYLLEDLEIGYLENAADLLDEPGMAHKGVLVVGGVDFGGAEVPQLAMRSSCLDEDFAPLPGTEREATAVSDRLGRRRDVEVLTGDRATESAVAEAAAAAGIVHLATHGFFATGRCAIRDTANQVGLDPMILSGVALSGASGGRAGEDDGIWTAAEVALLDLRGTEVVVLSACETGLGEVVSGEGVLGLRRAFATAGARHLVMSLWSIPDEPTVALMDELYRGLVRKRTDPITALRAAQLVALRAAREASGTGNPQGWGAFIAAGR